VATLFDLPAEVPASGERFYVEVVCSSRRERGAERVRLEAAGFSVAEGPGKLKPRPFFPLTAWKGERPSSVMRHVRLYAGQAPKLWVSYGRDFGAYFAVDPVSGKVASDPDPDA